MGFAEADANANILRQLANDQYNSVTFNYIFMIANDISQVKGGRT